MIGIEPSQARCVAVGNTQCPRCQPMTYTAGAKHRRLDWASISTVARHSHSTIVAPLTVALRCPACNPSQYARTEARHKAVVQNER